MAKHPEIRIDDLYAAVADDPARYICGDKIHYNSDGVALQAKAVAQSIVEALRNGAKPESRPRRRNSARR